MRKNFNKITDAKHGKLIYNENDIYVGRSIEKYGEFSENEITLFAQICNEGDIVVEVGGNIGAHTVALANLVGENGSVCSFEPQRVLFQTLCGNLAINSLQNVFAYPYGVGEENGKVRIPYIDYSKEFNYGGIEIEKFEHGENVRVVSLDSFLMLKSLKLLKIDVEGMEEKVLKGARKTIERFKPFIYLENDRVGKSKDLIELLFQLDYRCYWHIPLLFNEDNFKQDKEDIFKEIISINMLCIHKSFDVPMKNFTEVTDSSFHPMANR